MTLAKMAKKLLEISDQETDYQLSLMYIMSEAIDGGCEYMFDYTEELFKKLKSDGFKVKIVNNEGILVRW